MWSQAAQNTMVLQPVTDFGWNLQNGTLSIVWDTQENMDLVQKKVASLLKVLLDVVRDAAAV